MTTIKDANVQKDLSRSEKAGMSFKMTTAPVLVNWAIATSPFTSYGRAKSAKRNAADRFLRMVCTGMNRRQARLIFGTTRGLYEDFMKTRGQSTVIEEIGEEARLLWIGPKQTERVILYLHGGAFIYAMPGAAAPFWAYMKDNLEKKGKSVGVAILNYTLVPDSTFPTQLKQTIAAINHLIASGVRPENIQLVGDSAGATLMHGVFSHILHPLKDMPELSLAAPFGGAYMMSPWTRLVDKDGCLYTQKSNADFLNGKTLDYWGKCVLDGVPKQYIPYLEANSAPSEWMVGVDKCVKRILISSGGNEALCDEIVKYQETMKKHHQGVSFILQKHAIHNDPYLDFFTGEKDLGKVTPAVLNFLDEGFSTNPL